MRMFIMVLMAVAFGFTSFAADKPYAQTTTNQLWYMVKKGVERFEWVDHLGRTNIGSRVIGSTTNTRTSSRNYGITVDAQLNALEYEVFNVSFFDGWDIKNICPGKYDLVGGKWYFDMTDAEKTAAWVAYTNSYITAYNDRIAKEKEEASAPAKFDLSKTPDEYKASLLGDRSYDDLMPNEKRELSADVAEYRIEWTRINDPEAWWRMKRPLLPGNDIRSEQEKIRSSRGSAIRR